MNEQSNRRFNEREDIENPWHAFVSLRFRNLSHISILYATIIFTTFEYMKTGDK
jgi:hypothetical protein